MSTSMCYTIIQHCRFKVAYIVLDQWLRKTCTPFSEYVYRQCSTSPTRMWDYRGGPWNQRLAPRAHGRVRVPPRAVPVSAHARVRTGVRALLVPKERCLALSMCKILEPRWRTVLKPLVFCCAVDVFDTQCARGTRREAWTDFPPPMAVRSRPAREGALWGRRSRHL